MIPWFPWRILFACLTLLCLAASSASSLGVYPHSLAYFNEAVGGPKNGWRHMLGSNLDWGQDFLALASWIDHQQGSLPLYVNLRDLWNPQHLKASKFVILQNSSCLTGDEETIARPFGGFYAVSANYLCDKRRSSIVQSHCNSCDIITDSRNIVLDQIDPAARIGYTIMIFNIRDLLPRDHDSIADGTSLSLLHSVDGAIR